MSSTQREQHATESREWQDQFVMNGDGQWRRRDEENQT